MIESVKIKSSNNTAKSAHISQLTFRFEVSE